MKVESTKNSSWMFYPDQMQVWAYWENAFTSDECDEIISIGEQRFLEKGTIQNEQNYSSVRESEISWLYPADHMGNVFRKCTDIIMSLNNDFFKYDLYGMVEGFQFTKYTAPSGQYGKHNDMVYGGPIRKLSLVLQLSDPQDYEGGELNIYASDSPDTMSKARGTLFLFPSFMLHQVTPVTKGIRYSLVSWITGPAFK